MKIEQQVCTLEQAKRLKELGVKQFSVFVFGRLDRLAFDSFDANEWHEKYHAAFTVAELGRMLPDHAISYKAGINGWMGSIKQGDGDMNIGGKTEAQARAAMLIHLLEQNLISVTDVNSRL